MKAQTQLLIALACVATVSWGQQTPPSPAVRAFGDNKFWITVEDMIYVIGSTSERIVVPKGFVTDFASIPQPLWSLGLTPDGQYSRAAVVHDYLYWSQGCTRAQSDRLLVSRSILYTTTASIFPASMSCMSRVSAGLSSWLPV